MEYIGSIENGNINGKGKITFTNGVVYTGEFNHNKINGNGKLEFSPQETYTGAFLNFQKNGYGVYQNLSTGINYEGEWLNDCFQGKGTLTQIGEWTYSGEFKDNKKDGYGIINYHKTGSFFKGNFQNGLKSGLGEMFWATQNHHFTGFWQNDLVAGFGVYTYIDALDLNRYIHNIYIGTMISSQKEGIGFHVFSDGSLLTGKWTNGSKEGDFVYRDSFGHFCLKRFLGNHLKSNSPLQIDPGISYVQDSSLPKIHLLNQDVSIDILSNLLKTYYSFMKEVYKKTVNETFKIKDSTRKIYCLNLTEVTQLLKTLRFFDTRNSVTLFEKLVRSSCHNGILLDFKHDAFLEFTDEFNSFMSQQTSKLTLPYNLRLAKSEDIYLSCGQFINAVFMSLQIKFLFHNNFEQTVRTYFDEFLVPVFNKKVKLVTFIQEQKSILALYNSFTKQHRPNLFKLFSCLDLSQSCIITNKQFLRLLVTSKLISLEQLQHLSVFLRVTERFNDPFTSIYLIVKTKRNVNAILDNAHFATLLANILTFDEFVNNLFLITHKLTSKNGNHFPRNEVVAFVTSLFEDTSKFISSKKKVFLAFKWSNDAKSIKQAQFQTTSALRSKEFSYKDFSEEQIEVTQSKRIAQELMSMKMEDVNALLFDFVSNKSIFEKVSLSDFKDSVPEFLKPIRKV